MGIVFPYGLGLKQGRLDSPVSSGVSYTTSSSFQAKVSQVLGVGNWMVWWSANLIASNNANCEGQVTVGGVVVDNPVARAKEKSVPWSGVHSVVVGENTDVLLQWRSPSGASVGIKLARIVAMQIG